MARAGKLHFNSLLLVLDSIDADIYAADLATYEILYMNRHMGESFGGNFAGQVCYRVFRKESSPCPHCSNPRLLDGDGKPTGLFVWEGRNPITGRWYKNFDRVIPWEDGRYVRLQIATDITDLKEAEERLLHLATHDPLTCLPHRQLFDDRLKHALDLARRAQGRLALLFLDLDGFKAVNDRHGHQTGDELLRGVAERLLRALRRSCCGWPTRRCTAPRAEARTPWPSAEPRAPARPENAPPRRTGRGDPATRGHSPGNW